MSCLQSLRDLNVYPDEHKKLTVGSYTVDLGSGENGMLTCWDARDGKRMRCRVYSREKLMQIAPILSYDLNGMTPMEELVNTGAKTFLVYPDSHGDLHGYLKRRQRLPEPMAAAYFKQMLEMLCCAHSRGVVLRDLKLKKFIFVDPGRTLLNLTDVDDATILPSSGLLEDRHGCPAYVAPEMLHQGPYLGIAADMWSAGIILYTLLVGHYPFFDTNPQLLFAKIRSGSYYVPDHVSHAARSLISSLLFYDPVQRPSAEAALHHPWLTHPPLQQEHLPIHLAAEHDQTVPKLC